MRTLRFLLLAVAAVVVAALVGASLSHANGAATTNVYAWVGLKNSDDVGTSFDLKAVVTAGLSTGAGELDNFSGGSSGFNNAHLATIPVTGYSGSAGQQISVQIYARVSCVSKHTSGTARLWWNDSQANSGVEEGYGFGDLYLTGADTLSPSVGPGPKMTKDVLVKKSGCPADQPEGNWKLFGTWTFTPAGPSCTGLSEGFDDITTLIPGGWYMQNNSDPLGGTGWFQADPYAFTAQAGAENSYIAANYNNTGTVGTISNWLLTPPLTLANGASFSFYTRAASQYFPDRLQVRLSENGTSTNVGSGATDTGDFTTLLLDINPTLARYTYPETWTPETITLSGIPTPTEGRIAFRYFVENGGAGDYSNYIGIDTAQYTCPS